MMIPAHGPVRVLNDLGSAVTSEFSSCRARSTSQQGRTFGNSDSSCSCHEAIVWNLSGDMMRTTEKGEHSVAAKLTDSWDGEVEEVPSVGCSPESRGRCTRHHLDPLAVAFPLSHQKHREAGAQHGRCHCQAQHQQQITCHSESLYLNLRDKKNCRRSQWLTHAAPSYCTSDSTSAQCICGAV